MLLKIVVLSLLFRLINPFKVKEFNFAAWLLLVAGITIGVLLYEGVTK